MKKAFFRTVSVILCIAMAAAVLLSASVSAGIAGDINRDGEVNNKDVVMLFRYISGGEADVDEIACDTNGDGDLNNKDVVILFRYVSDPNSVEIFYGKETETEETTGPDETEPDETGTEPETESETETEPETEGLTESKVGKLNIDRIHINANSLDAAPDVKGDDPIMIEVGDQIFILGWAYGSSNLREIVYSIDGGENIACPGQYRDRADVAAAFGLDPSLGVNAGFGVDIGGMLELAGIYDLTDGTYVLTIKAVFNDDTYLAKNFNLVVGTGIPETEPDTEPNETDPDETEPDETGTEIIDPAEGYDNVFAVWNNSVKNTFSNLKQTDLTIKDNGIHLKYTGTSRTADPQIIFNISEYARIMNKRALTGADGSYIVIKLKSNTDGDFQIFTKATGGELKTVSYIPSNEFRYIIADMTATKLIQQETLTTIRLDWGSTKTQPGAEAVITEIGFFDTLEGALDYAAVIAGTQSDIVRDGTPKKYVTMSFDDATKQDLKVIEILKKYDIPNATFFINTGLCGHDWSANVSQMVGKQVEHIRFTMDELRTGIYDGYDLESHTLTHPSMKQYDNNPDMIKKELITDALNIFNLTGIYPAGLAWPGSSAEETNTTRKLVYENTNLRFGRGTTFQNGIKNRFKLPTEFLIWEPTNSMSNSSVINLFQKFLSKECTEDMLFYGFAHGFEFDVNNSWDIFEQFIQMVSQAQKSGDIIVVSNAEFYQLFKDQIPAYIPAE